MKKSILIISYSNLDTDPRVLRQIQTLCQFYSIHTAGICSSKHSAEKSFIKISEGIEFTRSIAPRFRKIIDRLFIAPIQFIYSVYRYQILLKFFKSYDSFYWTFLRKNDLKNLSNKRYDLIIANDLSALPLAVKLKERFGGKIYFDAHEYSPLEYENDKKWLKWVSPYIIYLCKKYVPYSDYNTTVSQGIAEAFPLIAGKNFDVVLNAPNFEKLVPSTNTTGIIKFIHHGVAAPDRNTDKLIEAFSKSKRSDIELHLMIININSEYGKYIQELAKQSKKVFLHSPVPTKEISRYINQFDIGIYFLPPLNFNQIHALPNKFFEFIQARLMLVMGPSHEMRQYIERYRLGIVASGFEVEDILNCIDNITLNDVIIYKQNVDKASLTLSAESSMALLLQNIKRIIDN